MLFHCLDFSNGDATVQKLVTNRLLILKLRTGLIYFQREKETKGRNEKQTLKKMRQNYRENIDIEST
jgi:hypothetical protein